MRTTFPFYSHLIFDAGHEVPSSLSLAVRTCLCSFMFIDLEFDARLKLKNRRKREGSRETKCKEFVTKSDIARLCFHYKFSTSPLHATWYFDRKNISFVLRSKTFEDFIHTRVSQHIQCTEEQFIVRKIVLSYLFTYPYPPQRRVCAMSSRIFVSLSPISLMCIYHFTAIYVHFVNKLLSHPLSLPFHSHSICSNLPTRLLYRCHVRLLEALG